MSRDSYVRQLHDRNGSPSRAHAPAHSTCRRRVTRETPTAWTSEQDGGLVEIKEWLAVMDHLGRLPVDNNGDLPILHIDERAPEVQGIKEG